MTLTSLILVLCTSTLFAAGTSEGLWPACERSLLLLRRHSFHGGAYVELVPQSSVLLLMEKLETTLVPFSREKARVLVINNPEDLNLHPDSSRLRVPSSSWPYHVVLEYEGLIYDLALKAQSPVPVREYFRRVFPKENDKIKVRTIKGPNFVDRGTDFTAPGSPSSAPVPLTELYPSLDPQQ